MSNLIESSEFGDWLIAEIAQISGQNKSANSEESLIGRSRLEQLQIAKKVLLEFLTLQQKMLKAASAARRQQAHSSQSA